MKSLENCALELGLYYNAMRQVISITIISKAGDVAYCHAIQ